MEARESQIHGMGLFAKENFGSGDTILLIKGEVRQTDDLSDDFIKAGQWQGINKTECLVARQHSTLFRYINHSKKPTAFVDLSLRKVIAINDIEKDTEITIDYDLEPMNERCKKLLGRLKP